MPIALQLPDWNAWLPRIHPLDIWGDSFLEQETYKRYLEFDNPNFQSKLADPATNAADIKHLVNQFRGTMDSWIKFMGGPQPCVNYNKG